MKISAEKQKALELIFGGFIGEDLSHNDIDKLLLHLVKKFDMAILHLVKNSDPATEMAGTQDAFSELMCLRNALLYGSIY